MKVLYRVREERYPHPDGGRYIGYGIEAVESISGEVLHFLPDVFCEWEQARAFAEKCNEGALAVMHLTDAAVDALITEYSLL